MKIANERQSSWTATPLTTTKQNEESAKNTDKNISPIKSSVPTSPVSTPKSPTFVYVSKINVSNGPSHQSSYRSMSPLRRSSGTSSFTRERTISPSRQRSVSPAKDALAGKTVNGTAKSTSLGSIDALKTTKQNEESAKNTDKNISPIKTEKNISSLKSSQSSTKISARQENSDSVKNKMVFGLNERTSKSKYMQIANERQSSGTTTPLTTNKSKLCLSNDPLAFNAANSISKSPKQKFEYKNAVSNEQRNDVSPKSDDSNKTMEQILAEAMQLIDDGKSSLVLSRSNSSDSTEGSDRDTRVTDFSMENNESDSGDQKCNDYNFSSPVDYAKSRFITINKVKSNGSNYALKDTNDKPKQSLVTEAKQKWENNEFANSSSSSKKFIRSHNFNLNFTEREKEALQELQNGLITPSQHLLRHNPITPFLTKGSVAERVMLFEKRPEIRKEKEPSNAESDSISGKGVKRSKSATLFSTWRNSVGNEVSYLRHLHSEIVSDLVGLLCDTTQLQLITITFEKIAAIVLLICFRMHMNTKINVIFIHEKMCNAFQNESLFK
ncbi:hypothetical protein B4U80_05540 [Leptotrombidium deliense]|uniref:Uncharacterized protein n=1 Tax=Leptotrombidium deliense TaxID=299467 RepID=A0A443SQ57_9ACAR|nr:hypothetical protein B4U80_05540 [Leptotrombidium deliense]